MHFKRIVVLGHNGFIGSHLDEAITKKWPDIELVGKSAPEFDLCDLKQVQDLEQYFDSHTAVIMCSAIKRQFGDNLETFSKNLNMCLNLCRVLEEKPVGRLIYFSSSAVYGEDIHNTNITEETPIRPTSNYGIVKYAAENLFQKVFKTYTGSSLVILRPPVIYGPGDGGATYGPVGFLEKALKNEEIVLWGDGEELREFIYIDDIVEIVLSLLIKDFAGVLNIASGKSCTFKEILDKVTRLSSNPLKVTSRVRTKDKVDNQFNNTKFLSVLKGFEFTSIEQGINKTAKVLKRKFEEVEQPV